MTRKPQTAEEDGLPVLLSRFRGASIGRKDCKSGGRRIRQDAALSLRIEG